MANKITPTDISRVFEPKNQPNASPIRAKSGRRVDTTHASEKTFVLPPSQGQPPAQMTSPIPGEQEVKSPAEEATRLLDNLAVEEQIANSKSTILEQTPKAVQAQANHLANLLDLLR
jgi:hypothetical protein